MIADFKVLEFISVYFYNCFDTECKKYLVGFLVILYFITTRNEKGVTEEGRVARQHYFVFCFNVIPSFFCIVAHWRTVSIFLPMQ